MTGHNVCGSENDDQARVCAKGDAETEFPVPETALQFTYIAVDGSGQQVLGMISASDERNATIAVERLGFVPVSIARSRSSLAVAVPPAKASAEKHSQPEPKVLRLQCPICQQRVEAESHTSDGQLTCTKCRRKFNIPSAGQVAPLGAPAGLSGARRFGKRRTVLTGLAALLVVIGGVLAFVFPKYILRAVKKPPLGWVGHGNTPTQSLIYLPPQWKYLSERLASSKGFFTHSTQDYMIFINDEHLRQQITVAFFGWKGTDDLKAKGIRGFLADNMLKKEDAEKENAKIISQVIRRLAGGTAAETVVEKKNEGKTRIVLLVTENRVGAQQIVKLTLVTDKDAFDAVDTQVFRPMLESFAYCVENKVWEDFCKAER